MYVSEHLKSPLGMTAYLVTVAARRRQTSATTLFIFEVQTQPYQKTYLKLHEILYSTLNAIVAVGESEEKRIRRDLLCKDFALGLLRVFTLMRCIDALGNTEVSMGALGDKERQTDAQTILHQDSILNAH